MVSIDIPKEFGYVVIVNIIGTFFTLMYLGGEVMQARKKYNVQYPNMYATPTFHKNADEFNNVQRGHQNALETYTGYLVASIVGGLKHPIIVAAGGVCWIIGRVLFMEGYKGGPEKRYGKGGGLLWIGVLSSLGSSISVAYSLLSA